MLVFSGSFFQIGNVNGDPLTLTKKPAFSLYIFIEQSSIQFQERLLKSPDVMLESILLSFMYWIITKISSDDLTERFLEWFIANRSNSGGPIVFLSQYCFQVRVVHFHIVSTSVVHCLVPCVLLAVVIFSSTGLTYLWDSGDRKNMKTFWLIEQSVKFFSLNGEQCRIQCSACSFELWVFSFTTRTKLFNIICARPSCAPRSLEAFCLGHKKFTSNHMHRRNMISWKAKRVC